MANVYWITGLSGAGKTTIGRIFYERLKTIDHSTIFLDGDTMRKVFGEDLGYSEEERRKCAMRYSRICQLLVEQEINVVICTISMFHAVRDWNRENISGYKEIYIKATHDTLYKRDQKGLYSGNTDEPDMTVAGIQIPFEEPRCPDLILENNGDISPEEQVEIIIKQFSVNVI